MFVQDRVNSNKGAQTDSAQQSNYSVAKEGRTVDFLLSERRDMAAAT
jgi:hypothetical protein